VYRVVQKVRYKQQKILVDIKPGFDMFQNRAFLFEVTIKRIVILGA
jgi:hypothetical protein